MKLPPGIETRIDSDGIPRYRGHAKHGGVKTRGPWTPDLAEARLHRIQLVGELKHGRDTATGGMLYHGAARPGVNGVVYFIQAGRAGPIKIGHTRGVVGSRFKALQTHNHEELRVLGTITGTMGDEKALHRELAAFRIRGEWFRPSPEVIAKVPVGPSADPETSK